MEAGGALIPADLTGNFSFPGIVMINRCFMVGSGGTLARSKIIASALAAFLVVLFSIYWIAAAPRELLAVPGKVQPDTGAGITKDSIPELKKKLWAAQNYQEINKIINSLNSLPGPNAEAVGVLLEYLKEDNRDDVWRISDALIKLMTGDQVARLAGEMALYPEANIGRYLIPVLAARIDDKQSVFSGVSGAGSASPREAFRRGVLQPIAIYSVILAGSLLLPDAHIIQYGPIVEYENYDVSVVFLLGTVILTGISLSVSMGGYFFSNHYLRTRL